MGEKPTPEIDHNSIYTESEQASATAYDEARKNKLRSTLQETVNAAAYDKKRLTDLRQTLANTEPGNKLWTDALSVDDHDHIQELDSSHLIEDADENQPAITTEPQTNSLTSFLDKVIKPVTNKWFGKKIPPKDNRPSDSQ